MNKHSTINVKKRIDPATVDPATNSTIGRESLAGPLVLVTTLGSIGDGVDGSAEIVEKKMEMINIHSKPWKSVKVKEEQHT